MQRQVDSDENNQSFHTILDDDEMDAVDLNSPSGINKVKDVVSDKLRVGMKVGKKFLIP